MITTTKRVCVCVIVPDPYHPVWSDASIQCFCQGFDQSVVDLGVIPILSNRLSQEDTHPVQGFWCVIVDIIYCFVENSRGRWQRGFCWCCWNGDASVGERARLKSGKDGLMTGTMVIWLPGRRLYFASKPIDRARSDLTYLAPIAHVL